MTEAGSAERRIFELAAQHGIAAERLPLEDWYSAAIRTRRDSCQRQSA